MAKSVAKSENPGSACSEEYGESTNISIPLEEWLPPMPDRQVLVIGENNSYTTGTVERLVQEMMPCEANALASRSEEQDKILNRPCITDFKLSDPYTLPYDSGRFDLAVFAFGSAAIDIQREALSEIGRVIDSEGLLLIIDYLVPGSRLRGKKARQLRHAGDYINSWMRLRNVRHKKYLDRDAWIQHLTNAQWDIQQMEMREVPQDFDTWADADALSAETRIRLRAMLIQAPEKAHRFLTPQSSGDRIAFRMTQVFILATMARNSVEHTVSGNAIVT